MSLFGMQKFIYELKKDKALQQSFKSDAEGAMATFALSAEEKTALRDGDLVGLYRRGVHPLLLAPYSRFMGISRPNYKEQLNPLRGTQRMKS
jgi:hypothetical protein